MCRISSKEKGVGKRPRKTRTKKKKRKKPIDAVCCLLSAVEEGRKEGKESSEKNYTDINFERFAIIITVIYVRIIMVLCNTYTIIRTVKISQWNNFKKPVFSPVSCSLRHGCFYHGDMIRVNSTVTLTAVKCRRTKIDDLIQYTTDACQKLRKIQEIIQIQRPKTIERNFRKNFIICSICKRPGIILVQCTRTSRQLQVHNCAIIFVYNQYILVYKYSSIGREKHASIQQKI